MKTRSILMALVVCLFLAVPAFAGPTSTVRVGFPEDGVTTDVTLGWDFSRFTVKFNALEASLNNMEDEYSYLALELGYQYGAFTPFVTMAKVANTEYEWISDGDGEKRELIAESEDTAVGIGAYAKRDFGRVVVDGSYRGFNYNEEWNGLAKANLKYRVAERSFISLGYTRWDSGSTNAVSSFGIGMEIGW